MFKLFSSTTYSEFLQSLRLSSSYDLNQVATALESFDLVTREEAEDMAPAAADAERMMAEIEIDELEAELKEALAELEDYNGKP